MNMIHALGQQYDIPTIGPIRTDPAVGKAHRAHQFLADFDPKSKALEDYEQVATQLLEFFGVAVQHQQVESIEPEEKTDEIEQPTSINP
jgi:nitrogenase subunit NifH